MVRKNPIIDGVWKARHKIPPNVVLDDAPTGGSIYDDRNRDICGV
jgi:hypothetical protein